MAEPSYEQPTPLDKVAVALQQRRAAAGNPSYADLVHRIGEARLAQGRSGDRPGRTTIYDAFRTGRRRLDQDLVVEIVRALGADDAEVLVWEERCRRAQRGLLDIDPPSPGEDPSPRPSARFVPTPQLIWRLSVLCVLVNLLGRALTLVLPIPLFLDMVGTAVAAVVLGPWWGVLVGVSTNLAGVSLSGWSSVPFLLVNAAGALAWGYGVRRFRMARSIPHFFVLNVIVAVVCSAVAIPILIVLFGGVVGSNATSDVALRVHELTHSLVLGVLTSNLLASIADKMLAGFVALVASEAILTPTGEGRTVPASARLGLATD